MYSQTAAYTISVVARGVMHAAQEFSSKPDALAWFKRATTDTDWFGPGMTVTLRHRGNVLKRKAA